MDSVTDDTREMARDIGGNYMNYAMTAQQELLQLGMNLFQRQWETSRKIVGSRDFGQAIGAWTDLAKNTVEDFSATTTRLLDHACAAGSNIAQTTQEGFRAAAERTKRAGEAAAGQR
jgi:hypothetical protein